jgi:hypothetical protein
MHLTVQGNIILSDNPLGTLIIYIDLAVSYPGKNSKGKTVIGYTEHALTQHEASEFSAQFNKLNDEHAEIGYRCVWAPERVLL